MPRPSRPTIRTLSLLAVSLVAAASVARALDVEGVHFADSLDVGGQHLVLNGVGVRHATIFNVSVYAAGLYVPTHVHDGARVLDPSVPKHLIAVFRRGVSHDDARNAFRDAIRTNAGSGAASIASEITAFEAWIPAFETGQRLTATFTPGTGIELGATQAHARFHASVTFGTALFKAWVGPHPVDDGLRDGLLDAHH